MKCRVGIRLALVIKSKFYMYVFETPRDLRNGLSVEANTLGGVDEMRRGEEPGAQPAPPQNGLQEGAGRTLALH